MNKRVNYSLVIASFFVLVFFAPIASAQTTTTNTTESVTSTTSAQLKIVLTEFAQNVESLTGIKVKEPAEAVGGLGVWWRGLRENISLALTFDSIKKAEKQLIYAEERMKLAEKIIAKSNSPRAQELAQKVMKRAGEFILKIENKKNKWELADPDLVEVLKRNLIAHQIRRDDIMAEIEQKVTGDATDAINNLREKFLTDSQRILAALNNEKIPADVRKHLEYVQDRIAKHNEAVKKYREEKMEVLKDTVNKDEVKEKIEDLWEQRRAEMDGIKLDYKVKIDDLVEKILQGNKEAEEKLKAIELIKENLKNKQQMVKERMKKLLEMKREGMSERERLQKLEELRAEDEKKADDLLDDDSEENKTSTSTAKR